jgi:hypothetical protein
MPTLLEPRAIDSDARLAQKIAALEQRINDLERTQASIPVVGGAPTSVSGDGQMAGDSVNTRLWLRVSGTWRYVTLT